MNYKPQKKLLSFNNFKMQKSVKFGYLTAILHLAPYNLSGYNICPKATVGCATACLNTAGRGQMNCVQKSRINKTLYFINDRQKFLEHLHKEITTYEKMAKKKKLKLAVRLNGTSDLAWERYRFKDYKNIMELFPKIPFYDYTKILNRFSEILPKNYNLTFSRSENNTKEVNELMTTNNNIAVVFNKLPKKYLGRKVVTGDESDLRFLDPKKTIIGLLAKGRAKKDNSGFTVIN